MERWHSNQSAVALRNASYRIRVYRLTCEYPKWLLALGYLYADQPVATLGITDYRLQIGHANTRERISRSITAIFIKATEAAAISTLQCSQKVIEQPELDKMDLAGARRYRFRSDVSIRQISSVFLFMPEKRRKNDYLIRFLAIISFNGLAAWVWWKTVFDKGNEK